jgi:CheB methylesterase
MPAHDIIVVGFSAGGVEALQVLVRGLLRHLLASVFIAQHGRAHRSELSACGDRRPSGRTGAAIASALQAMLTGKCSLIVL